MIEIILLSVNLAVTVTSTVLTLWIRYNMLLLQQESLKHSHEELPEFIFIQDYEEEKEIDPSKMN